MICEKSANGGWQAITSPAGLRRKGCTASSSGRCLRARNVTSGRRDWPESASPDPNRPSVRLSRGAEKETLEIRGRGRRQASVSSFLAVIGEFEGVRRLILHHQ